MKKKLIKLYYLCTKMFIFVETIIKIKIMKVKEIKTGSFVGNYPINKLKHSLVNRDIVNNHYEQFGKKISQYGWLSPIIIDDKGNIIEGHHRAMAADKMNLKSVPVYVVDWVNTKDLDEYQKYIISLNSSNRKWSALDYLKSFSRNKKAYTFVYNRYETTKDVFSVGNLLNIYFNSGCNQQYREGKSNIKDMEFSNFMCDNFLELKRMYGGVKFQAFTINRVTTFAHQKIKGNKKEMSFIFKQLELLAKANSPLLSSVEMINPWLKDQLKMHRSI